MTLIAGCNLGPYAVIAADTRESYYVGYSKLHHRDGKEKIQRTPLGVITGSGYIPLLDAVKKRIAEIDAIGNTDDIVRIIKEERARLSPELLASDDHLAESVEHYTSWIFTYMGVGRSEVGEGFDTAGLRLALAHPEHDYVIGLYGINRGVISFPDDVDADLMESLRERLNAGIKPLSDLSEFRQNVFHHVALRCSRRLLRKSRR